MKLFVRDRFHLATNEFPLIYAVIFSFFFVFFSLSPSRVLQCKCPRFNSNSRDIDAVLNPPPIISDRNFHLAQIAALWRDR